jgi:maltodextrin utilization protein YvdJ
MTMLMLGLPATLGFILSNMIKIEKTLLINKKRTLMLFYFFPNFSKTKYSPGKTTKEYLRHWN